MAIEFVAEGTHDDGAGSCTPTIPTHEAGDLILAWLEMAGDQTLVGNPLGWTEIASPQSNPGSGLGDSTQAWLGYIVAADDSTVDPEFVGANGSRHMVANVAVFRGVDTDTPLDQTTTEDSYITNDTAQDHIPDITTQTDGAMVVFFAACGDWAVQDPFFTDWACADLVSITVAFDDGTTSGSDGAIGCAYGIKTTAGLVNGATATAATEEEEANATVALRPAGGGGGGGGYGADIASPGQVLKTGG